MSEMRSNGEKPAAGGFRSQPLALKILLFVSLAAVAVGVVRCSIEATQELPPVTSIGIAPVDVRAGDEQLPAPADSIRVIARRVFERNLRTMTDVDVVRVEPMSVEVDAIVNVRVTVPDESMLVEGVIQDMRAGGVVGSVDAQGPPRALYGLLNIIARKTVEELNVERLQ